MVKLILRLPMHVEGEPFMNLVMDVIKGRYGRDSYYNGVEPKLDKVIFLNLEREYQKRYGYKAFTKYYEIDAEELDPIIIATMLELGKLFGLDGYFQMDSGEYLNNNWWVPTDKDFQHAPHYGDFWESVTEAREEYAEKLKLLGGYHYGNG